MTETLAEKTCTPCRGGVPPLARDEALHFQKQAPDWDDISFGWGRATVSLSTK